MEVLQSTRNHKAASIGWRDTNVIHVKGIFPVTHDAIEVKYCALQECIIKTKRRVAEQPRNQDNKKGKDS